MVNSNNLTVTKGRLDNKFNRLFENYTEKSGIKEVIRAGDENSKAHTGHVTKFYPYLDKAEVVLDGSHKKIYCKILHMFGGELLELFTPFGDNDFCDTLKEPCVIPRDLMSCFVVDISNKDNDDWLLLGYYNSEEIIGLDPAKPGNMKLLTCSHETKYSIEFGQDGLDVSLIEKPELAVGPTEEEMEKQEIINKEPVYEDGLLDF